MNRLPQTEKMIAKVMKKKELSEKDAIEYMLAVATGRLTALWRYDETLPEGKRTKGILTTAGRKKRAERSKPIPAAASVSGSKVEEKPRKTKPRKPRKAPKQIEMAEVAQ